ncbi:hypothetical protein TD95_001187 [Thielaviopsis punctulata]|uniref:Uncharacterized protein n=1 Tax=Thielaviopsis punctulata TaxID=72032 RepID=A0A0F4ZJA7_9PEZI|nr:hypothetical protein TD95_001187 [Thielaviopsis punctulata]
MVLYSSGRGGSGNMSAKQYPPMTAADLATPTLKTPYYSTGRGGSGNMARNNDAAEARLRQDLDEISFRPLTGLIHSGRGGAGNVVNAEDLALAELPVLPSHGASPRRHSTEMLEKAKAFLRL